MKIGELKRRYASIRSSDLQIAFLEDWANGATSFRSWYLIHNYALNDLKNRGVSFVDGLLERSAQGMQRTATTTGDCILVLGHTQFAPLTLARRLDFLEKGLRAGSTAEDFDSVYSSASFYLGFPHTDYDTESLSRLKKLCEESRRKFLAL